MTKNFQSRKNKSEVVHKKFLLKHFELIEGFEGMRAVFGSKKPDFFYFGRGDPATMFELKTKIYPKNNPKNRGLKEYVWFHMEKEQIENYEEVWGREDKIKAWIYLVGFTRKPLGRGMGLYISKQVLNKIDYDIIVDEPRLDRGVTFRIFPITNS